MRKILSKLMENPVIFYVAQNAIPFTVWHYKSLIGKYVSISTNEKILDIGCGVGSYYKTLKGDYHGIDFNVDYMIKASKLYQNGKFFAMSAPKLAFTDNYFDQAFIIASLHHLTDQEVTDTINEALRVMKPAGKLHIIDAILPLSTRNKFKHALFMNDRGQFQRTYTELGSLLENTFTIDTSHSKKGIIHDTCYFRLTS